MENCWKQLTNYTLNKIWNDQDYKTFNGLGPTQVSAIFLMEYSANGSTDMSVTVRSCPG